MHLVCVLKNVQNDSDTALLTLTQGLARAGPSLCWSSVAVALCAPSCRRHTSARWAKPLPAPVHNRWPPPPLQTLQTAPAPACQVGQAPALPCWPARCCPGPGGWPSLRMRPAACVSYTHSTPSACIAISRRETQFYGFSICPSSLTYMSRDR